MKREQLKDKTKDCPHFHICKFAYERGFKDARALYMEYSETPDYSDIPFLSKKFVFPEKK